MTSFQTGVDPRFLLFYPKERWNFAFKALDFLCSRGGLDIVVLWPVFTSAGCPSRSLRVRRRGEGQKAGTRDLASAS